jgi:hypothetical protein
MRMGVLIVCYVIAHFLMLSLESKKLILQAGVS